MRMIRTTPYADRVDAGRVLAEHLVEHLGRPCVVVGIPRGGVLVADPIAERLDCPLTMSFARKLTLPESPEVAFGAIDEDGHVVVDHPRFHDLAGRPHDLFRARARVAQEIQRQQQAFPALGLDAFLPRCTVLLVDDGLATGYTMRAAIAHAIRHGAHRIVAATPCASASAAAEIECEVDAFVCPRIDAAFFAVGEYYLNFDPVTDEQVLAVLDKARERSRGRAQA